MKMLSVLMVLFSIAACTSTPPLTQEETRIRILRGSYSLKGCEHVGSLREYIPTSYSSDITNLDLGGDYLKRAALKMGANTVVQIGSATIGQTAYGTAYKCK